VRTLSAPVLAALVLFGTKGIAQHLSFPEGIRDPSQPTAYIRNGVTIEALNLTNGHAIWTYHESGHPIAVIGERLVIQVATAEGGFRLDILNKFKGTLMVQSETASFSRSARPSSYAIPRVTADATASSLHLTWELHPRYNGGANPPAQYAATLPSMVMQAQMDLKTGQILMGSEQLASPPVSCLGNSAPAPGGYRPVPYVKDGSRCDSAWSTPTSSNELIEDSNGHELLLHVREEKGGQRTHRLLSRGDWHSVPPYVTDDGEYLIVQVTYSDWEVYSTQTSKSIGHVFASNITDPTVVSNRLYYRSDVIPTALSTSERRALIAQDIPSGQLLWSLSLDSQSTSVPPKRPQ